MTNRIERSPVPLPRKRLAEAEWRRQRERLVDRPGLLHALDSVPDMILVVNDRRQCLHANRAFRDFLANEVGDPEAFRGQRPGEILGCIHRDEGPDGCGTSSFCRYCGAARSMARCDAENAEAVEECHLLRRRNGEEVAVDLRVWSSPLVVDDERFTLFSARDISDEHRRRILERIFFHDILNTAGGLRGVAAALAESPLQDAELEELARLLCESADDLLEEIRAYKTLTAAERGELEPEFARLNPGAVTRRVHKRLAQSEPAAGKTFDLQLAEEVPAIVSDASLLGRVLTNLCKNALEASGAGEAVRVELSAAPGGGVLWSVRNPAVMSEEVKAGVFKRSFSTKGLNRGLGTYSIRLLTESYLKGEVDFTSTAVEGTVFRLALPAGPDGRGTS